jgi:hypothetical protein
MKGEGASQQANARPGKHSPFTQGNRMESQQLSWSGPKNDERGKETKGSTSACCR